ncbi:MAG: acyltransferase family protein [Alphaproteobacteria bacterium]|nr:acyltransferase family protein [Alphaproteobacteria bacterium]MDA8005429.1 acyltransferase family protein [Alphaproteobacteria bacterium]MDA8013804.1 acyltransferase family protein [Alphaproteobacteria bacterium]
MTRRYDIDWLRVIAIALLLIYHIVVVFQPWAKEFWFIQSETPLEWLWILMAVFNVWRIPLLFVVSGMGVCFALARRNWTQLVRERSRRILLPFLFGFFFIVPIHIALFQAHYDDSLAYIPDMGHLWFLANIYIYALALSPLILLCRRRAQNRILTTARALLTSRFGIYLFAIPFIGESLFVAPGWYESYAYTAHGFWLGAVAFLSGATFIALGENLYAVLRGRWRLHCALAFALYLVRLFVFELEGVPSALTAIESLLWIFGVLGAAHVVLNRPSRALSYLSGAAYPVYVVHMVFLYLGAYMILPLPISALSQLFLIIVFTFGCCFFCYQFVILRFGVAAMLFGARAVRKIN